MNGSDQQAYDRGITIFSPDGRLYQVEYAREAVKRGAPSVGVTTDEGVVLAARVAQRSPLMVKESVEKLHRVDDHLGIATAGSAADARRLVDIARRVSQHERLRYGEPSAVEPLAKAVTDHVQEHTQTGGARPYGTALLVGGVDPDTGRARLFETDPSGTPYEWRATAIGRDSEAITGFLEEEYADELTAGEGVELAVDALASVADEDLEASGIDVATVAEDGLDRVDQSTVADVLAES